MMKQKLNWKRPLFYLLLPVFFIMVFLGFPIPVAPPPATKPAQEQTAVVRKKKKRIDPVLRARDSDEGGPRS